MKVLLSSIGSRGDVQPLLALALELRALGHEPRLCVESHRLRCFPIGPDVKKFTTDRAASKPAKPSMKRMRELAASSVREQFRVSRDHPSIESAPRILS
jgi:vancomycin aglycone glucosyltransferase